MKVDFKRLPKKAILKKNQIENVLKNANDKLYLIIMIDYNSGLIRFESMHFDNLFVNLYTSTFTMTVELRNPDEKNNQFHWKKINYKIVKEIFNDPKGFIYKSIKN